MIKKTKQKIKLALEWIKVQINRNDYFLQTTRRLFYCTVDGWICAFYIKVSSKNMISKKEISADIIA